MGLRGILVLCLSFACMVGRGETGIIATLLPALFGVSVRNVDDEYSNKLKLDPQVTVHLSLGMTGGCTGTFVTDTTLLTAGHCIHRDVPGGGVNVDGVQSIAFFMHDGFQYDDELDDEEKDNKAPDYLDLAVVVFPPGTGRELGIKKYPTLSETPVQTRKQRRNKEKLEIPAYIVGYGIDSMAVVEDEEQGIGLSDGEDIDLGSGVRGWGSFKIVKSRRGILLTEKTDLPLSFAIPENGEAEVNAGGEEGLQVLKVEPLAPGSIDSAGLPGDSGASIYNKDGVILGILASMDISQAISIQEGLSEEELEQLEDNLDLIEVTHRINNMIVDVTSTSSRTLFRKAILCDKEPCADNFVGSRVSETEKALQSNKEYDKARFAHISARTGVYHSNDNGASTVYITPRYLGNKLMTVEKREFSGKSVSESTVFRCRQDICREKGGKTRLYFDGNKFLQKNGKSEKTIEFTRVVN